MYIDGYGDAEGNYTLLKLEQDGEEGQLNMRPVGNFRMTQSGVGIPVRKWIQSFEHVLWEFLSDCAIS